MKIQYTLKDKVTDEVVTFNTPGLLSIYLKRKYHVFITRPERFFNTTKRVLKPVTPKICSPERLGKGNRAGVYKPLQNFPSYNLQVRLDLLTSIS